MEYQEGQVVFGRYRISGAVKKGGMGAVYRAVDLQFPGRGTLAVKEMLADIPQDEIRRIIQEKFEEEARVLVLLSHQGIPRVWDHFVSGDLHCIVMEFIEGDSLDEVLRDYLSLSGGPVPPALAVEFGVQLCEILEYLHTRPGHPILHRDIKPGNIIVRREGGRVVLVDFGLARSVNPLSFSTRTAVGTLGYAPLEQLRGQPDVRSDLYSLGATLHHLVGGQVPVPFDIPPLLQVYPEGPADLAAVIDRAVAQEPRARFQTAGEFRRALLDVQQHLATAGPRPHPGSPQAWPGMASPRPTLEAGGRTAHPLGSTAFREGDTDGAPERTARRRRSGSLRQLATLAVVAGVATTMLAVLYRLVLVPSGVLGSVTTVRPSASASLVVRAPVPNSTAIAGVPTSTSIAHASPRARWSAAPSATSAPARSPSAAVAHRPVPVRTVDVPSVRQVTPVAVKTVYVAASPGPAAATQATVANPPQAAHTAPAAGPPRFVDARNRFTFVVPQGYHQVQPLHGEDVRFEEEREPQVYVSVRVLPGRTDLETAASEHRRILGSFQVNDLQVRLLRLPTGPGYEFRFDEGRVGQRSRVIQLLSLGHDGSATILAAGGRAEGFEYHLQDVHTFFSTFHFLLAACEAGASWRLRGERLRRSALDAGTRSRSGGCVRCWGSVVEAPAARCQWALLM